MSDSFDYQRSLLFFFFFGSSSKTECYHSGGATNVDLNRGRSQRRQFLVMRSRVPWNMAVPPARTTLAWLIHADVNVTHKSRGFRLAPLPVNCAGATLLRNGPFGATVLMLPSGRTQVFSLSLSTLI